MQPQMPGQKKYLLIKLDDINIYLYPALTQKGLKVDNNNDKKSGNSCHLCVTIACPDTAYQCFIYVVYNFTEVPPRLLGRQQVQRLKT